MFCTLVDRSHLFTDFRWSVGGRAGGLVGCMGVWGLGAGGAERCMGTAVVIHFFVSGL